MGVVRRFHSGLLAGRMDLESLRQELDDLDSRLMAIAARRIQVVRRIGELKAGDDRPVFDRTRERDVYVRARDNAAHAGLDPKVGEALLQTLVEAGHGLQEELQPDSEAHRFCIVGGGGRMGTRIKRELEGRGHRVDVIEKDDPFSIAAEADIVMLSVPMARAASVARVIGPYLRSDALLCDVNSLKSEVCAAMAASHSGEILGLHPMFGPSVHTFRRQKVVICKVRPGPLGGWLVAELGRLGMERIEASPEEHDRMMANVQVLTHFSTLVMGDALRRTGVGVRRSLEFTSPIYRLELAFVGRLFAQNPDLYAEIEMSNPHGESVRAGFREAAEELTAILAAGDREAFRARFAEVSAHFEGFDAEAMRLSDLLIDTLAARP